MTGKKFPLVREITILDCFTQQTPEMGTREVARRLSMSSTTAGRLLGALGEAGVLQQNPTTRAYSLTGRVLAWSGAYLSNLDVRNKALFSMQQLAEQTGETISLYKIEGLERVCVERIESQHRVRSMVILGERMPMQTGTTGRVLLACLPGPQLDAMLTALASRYPDPVLADLGMFRQQLERVRQDGYALAIGEFRPEASAISAPVWNAAGECEAAICISGPTQRFEPDQLPGLISALTRAAAQASGMLGYRF
jgi:IclR family transcriptional regulator, KDG regulon repressor